MTLLDRVSAHLATHGVRHALIGATALAAAGVARSTFDVDLLAFDRRLLDASFWAPIAAADLSLDVRAGDRDDPLAGMVRLARAAERPVDVVVARHAWQARLVERARPSDSGPPIVGPVDLILLKLYAGGAQDLWDIRELLSLPGAERLVADVERELASLPAAMWRLWHTLR